MVFRRASAVDSSRAMLFNAYMEAGSAKAERLKLSSSKELGRPRTVLVLGGGGMRGMAHVGILRALKTLGIEYDAIVGTSIGSLVGAMAAGGASVDEIEETAETEVPRPPEPRGLRERGAERRQRGGARGARPGTCNRELEA